MNAQERVEGTARPIEPVFVYKIASAAVGGRRVTGKRTSMMTLGVSGRRASQTEAARCGTVGQSSQTWKSGPRLDPNLSRELDRSRVHVLRAGRRVCRFLIGLHHGVYSGDCEVHAG